MAMELLTLDTVSFKPTGIVDGFQSLIWTERYYEPGDFELKTSHINQAMNQLPLGSMVALSESEELMIVESHETEEDEDGQETITIKGRTFESFLENRIALDDSSFYNQVDPSTGLTNENVHAWFLNNSSWNDADACRWMIDRHIVTPILTDEYGDPDVSDIIPNVVVWNLSTANRAYYARFVERTDLHTQVMQLIKHGGYGIRNARPSSDQNLLRMVLYSGTDRSNSQSTNSRVVFDYYAGHLTNNKFFHSTVGHKNVVYIYPKNSRGGTHISNTGPSAPRKGLAKRSMIVDATEITATSALDVFPSVNARTYSEIANHKIQYSIDFKISPNVPFKYGVHYNLGDHVTIQGKYGQSKKMRVTEYIRTLDSDGEVGYPTVSEN